MIVVFLFLYTLSENWSARHQVWPGSSHATRRNLRRISKKGGQAQGIGALWSDSAPYRWPALSAWTDKSKSLNLRGINLGTTLVTCFWRPPRDLEVLHISRDLLFSLTLLVQKLICLMIGEDLKSALTEIIGMVTNKVTICPTLALKWQGKSIFSLLPS